MCEVCVCARLELRFCISNKLPGDSKVANLKITLCKGVGTRWFMNLAACAITQEVKEKTMSVSLTRDLVLIGLGYNLGNGVFKSTPPIF